MERSEARQVGSQQRIGISVAVGSLLLWGAMWSTAYAETAIASAKPMLDSSIESYQTAAAVTGRMVVAGSDTMQPIIVKLASAFHQWHPGVKIVVQGGGSYAGVKGFIIDQATIRRGDAKPSGHLVSGHVDLFATSTPMSNEDRTDFRSKYGYEVTEIPIALDAVAIYVNAQNPVQGVTLEQVDAIFGKDRKRGGRVDITRWGQLGLEEPWAASPIHLYGRDKKSGTRTFFIHEVLNDGQMKSDVVEEPGSASEIVDISRDRLGIGYAGIGFQASAVRVVPVAKAAGNEFVAPTAESATSGAYPLARYLYLYAKKSPGAPLESDVLEFLKFVNSREGQETIVRAGFFPLPAGQVAINMQSLVGPLTSAILTSKAEQ